MHRPSFVRAVVFCAGAVAIAPAVVFAQPSFAKVRLEVTPRDAAVYVDGLYSGIVDDFDGPTQRLPLPPGSHEIVIYQPGYRTVHQQLDLGTHGDYRARYTLEKLAAGETAEAPPAAATPAFAPPEPAQAPARNESAAMPEYGTVAIRVQPPDAEVLLDGEPWKGSGAAEPLSIHVTEGRHHVDVHKAGYRPFSIDVDVRRGESVPVNVSLALESER